MSASAKRLPRVPDELPLLRAGSHRGPRDGACLMEYVSVLAGERWSDDPRCVHPALAGLARAVNDDIHDDGVRSRLALLAPDLIAIDERNPRVGAQVIVTCLLGADAQTLPRSAASRLVTARRRVRGGPLGRWGWAWMRCRWMLVPPALSARRALRHFEAGLTSTGRTERDRKLYELFRSVLADCLELKGACGVPGKPHPVR